MTRLRCAAALTAVGCLLGPSDACADDAWKTMAYSDARRPFPDTATLKPIWQKDLAGKPFFQIVSQRFEVAGTTYLVSIAHALGLCTEGANGRNATAAAAICPARVDVLQDSKVVRTTKAKACFVSPLPDNVTANQSDVTQVQMTADGKGVETVFAGQKHRFGLFVRTISLARARTKIGLANLAYNLKRFLWIDGRPVAA